MKNQVLPDVSESPAESCKCKGYATPHLQAGRATPQYGSATQFCGATTRTRNTVPVDQHGAQKQLSGKFYSKGSPAGIERIIEDPRPVCFRRVLRATKRSGEPSGDPRSMSTTCPLTGIRRPSAKFSGSLTRTSCALSTAQAYLDCVPITSKLGKRMLVLDCKESMVNNRTRLLLLAKANRRRAGRRARVLVDFRDTASMWTVDGPIVLMFGAQAQRDRMLWPAVCVWPVLGLLLAFKKVSRGTDVTWVGFALRITNCNDAEVEVSGKAQLIHKVRTNVLAKDFRAFAGKANYIAGVVDVWTPFFFC